MRQIFIIIIALSLLMPTAIFGETHSQTNHAPMSLPWGKKLPETFQSVPGFRYWYGDMQWGEMIFTGDFQHMEAEVHLQFTRKMISSATLILGPKGINTLGCKETFLSVVNLLKQKYGQWKYAKTTESEIKADLFYTNLCSPVRVGVHTEEIRWVTDKFFIVAYLFGDGADIFIEVDYFYKPLKGVKKLNSGILKKL